MKNHKFQQIRVTVTKPGDSIRFNAQTDKQYARIRGIYVSIPEERLVPGCLLGLKVNNQDIFEDVHEVKLLTSGNQVAPNQKYFFFEELWTLLEVRLKEGLQMDRLRLVLRHLLR